MSLAMKRFKGFAYAGLILLYGFCIFWTEKPAPFRGSLMLGLIALLGGLFWADSKPIFQEKLPLRVLWTGFQWLGVGLLEYFSKFSLNYFMMPLYFVIIFGISRYGERRLRICLWLGTILVSFIKFTSLFYYNYNYFNLSQFVYVAVIELLFIVVAYYLTEYRQAKEAQMELIEALQEANIQLMDYSVEKEQMLLMHERSKISAELHDSLGHNLTGMIMQLEMSERLIKRQAYGEAENLLNQCKTDARQNLKALRAVVEDIGQETKHYTWPEIQEMMDLFADKTGLRIGLETRGTEKDLGDRELDLLHKILREALTNSVRHGKATEVAIHLSCCEGRRLEIRDNGRGGQVVSEGFGLRSIRETLEAIGGQIERASEQGFQLTLTWPALRRNEGEERECD